MRIQHNIMAMSAYRNYTNNVSAMKKNLEKLSSGYKINRAGDDAAGLAISEKMRAQITGLETAQKNAKDGISLVQTAEGALTEVHDMLNRMVELATQSANGTYDNTTDRAQMQKEIEQLKSEINRIADSSNFNGIKLLNGDMTSATSSTTYEYSFEGMTNMTILDGGVLSTVNGPAAGTSTVLHKDSEGSSLTSFEVDLRNTTVSVSTAGANAITLGLGGSTITIAASDLKAGKTYNGKDLANLFADGVSQGVLINGVSYNVSVADDGVLRFEMDSKAAAGITAATSFNVFTSINADVTIVVGTNDVLKADNVDDMIQNYKVGNMDNGTVYASTETIDAFFKNPTNLKDGAGVKIGDTAYVFATTKETLNADYGDKVKVVDLTDCLAANGSVDVAKADLIASRFTQAAADNEMFRVGVNSAGNISIRERPTYSGDADLTTLDGLKSQFQKFTGLEVSSTTTTGGGNGALMLQIGDTADDYNQLKVEIQDMHADAMGIGDISIADQESAAKAVDAIKAAINYVSDVRGTLGATQNRLDHTINNLSVMTENIQDAESTIRDVDVAEEMMAYTKNNILIQSAQAMLAQANQVPQGVLQLLQ